VPLVAFDLDGTLVDQGRAARAWAEEFVAEHGGPPSEAARIGRALAEPRPKGEVFAELARDWDLPITGDDVWKTYRARMPELVRCTDEDKDGLQALRRSGWAIGIVTNGMVDNQEGKIMATGLSDLVDGWVVSEAVGVRKPDPAIFHALARQLDCPLDGWMVGDSLQLDVAGGAAVGLRTAWVRPPGADPNIGVSPSVIADTAADAIRQILEPSPTV
jgi:HAD superfamily hydrolase (TIGR01549 family)